MVESAEREMAGKRVPDARVPEGPGGSGRLLTDMYLCPLMAFVIALHFVGYWFHLSDVSWYLDYCGWCIKAGLRFIGEHQLLFNVLLSNDQQNAIHLDFGDEAGWDDVNSSVA